ncbi:MAG: hypothetical protein ACUVQP_08190 [Bacteroidales bacterium]
MMINKLFDQTTNFIQRALDVLTIRHRIISKNISNAESQNYLGTEIPFQKILENLLGEVSFVSLQKTHPDHIEVEKEMLIETKPLEEKINLDNEMAKLAGNQLIFQAGVQALLKKLEALRIAIQEGGK